MFVFTFAIACGGLPLRGSGLVRRCRALGARRRTAVESFWRPAGNSVANTWQSTLKSRPILAILPHRTTWDFQQKTPARTGVCMVALWWAVQGLNL